MWSLKERRNKIRKLIYIIITIIILFLSYNYILNNFKIFNLIQNKSYSYNLNHSNQKNNTNNNKIEKYPIKLYLKTFRKKLRYC